MWIDVLFISQDVESDGIELLPDVLHSAGGCRTRDDCLAADQLSRSFARSCSAFFIRSWTRYDDHQEDRRPDFKSEAKPTGETLVSADSSLERILRGGEPRSVKELLALEKQQSQVASKIQSVTVNVQQGSSQGSGVIITGDGYVLTAAHVAGKPNRDAFIVLADGTKVRARTLGMNRYMDAGLIKITEKRDQPWPHASLGTSAGLQPGHWVIAAGHPGGWSSDRPSVFRVGRILEVLPSTLVTDCPLIGGDSGGPLFDLTGKLVGIHSRIGSDVSDNMHVPIDVFSESWDRLAKGEAWGTLPGFKPMIGVLGSNEDPRAIISSVIENSPASEAGIQVGDIVRKFDGNAIQSFRELIQAVEASLPGDRVTLEIERKGELIRVRVVVGVQQP